MHYKNGREARNGDTVIGKPQHGVALIVGIVQDINPGATTCNCTVIRPGGLIQNCVTLGEIFHAEDALQAIEEKTAQAKTAVP